MSDDKLNEVFEITDIEKVEEKTTEIVPSSTGEDLEVDYDYTRLNLYDLTEKGNRAIEGALEIALEGGHPRAYEVLATLIKNVGDTNEKIIDLHSKMNEINPKTIPTKVTNNSLFVGSTKELYKMIKEKDI
tara:strand:+ start:18972 stop:19364 length:393 start_codon:yes stop_codon:yes gene_type:complete